MNGQSAKMLGQKTRSNKIHTHLCLEDLVPADHFYRKLEAKLDLNFVRAWVKDGYSARLGRGSIDPVVFFKLQLIMFFEGIRSERALMESVSVNVAQRWYIGYDLDEAVPDHSTLSRIRERYGLEIFQRFFEKIVELCQTAGLVEGHELYFDATKVRANAAYDKLVPRFYWQGRQQEETVLAGDKQTGVAEAQASGGDSTATILHTVFAAVLAEADALPMRVNVAPRDLLNTYNGQRLTDIPASRGLRQTDYWVSPSDPDATPLRPGQDGSGRLGYHDQYVVDGGKARIILGVLVTPASVPDNAPLLDLERWVRFRWSLTPEIAVGDSKYGTVVNQVGLETDGLHAYLATPRLQERAKVFPPDKFHYDAQLDCYICPQQERLKRNSYHKQQQRYVYEAAVTVCRPCPLKAQCTTSSFRRIYRSVFQEVLDKVKAYHKTAPYLRAMRKRFAWMEPLFAEAKQWHHLAKFRLRTLRKVNIEALLIAAGQNLKRLLHPERYLPQAPALSAALLALPAILPPAIGFFTLPLLNPLFKRLLPSLFAYPTY